MKIASRATPEGLAGQCLSTTTIQHKQSVVNTPLERSRKNFTPQPEGPEQHYEVCEADSHVEWLPLLLNSLMDDSKQKAETTEQIF